MNVTIVGAGIVGVATGIYLRREGHEVTIVDRGPPGEGTSFGNAGSIAPGSIVPLALPGTFRQVPKWILHPLGPLSLSWRQVPALVPWLYHFYRACNAQTVRRTAAAMRSLNGPSVDACAELLAAAGAAQLLVRNGGMMVYRTERAFEASAYVRKLRTDNGVSVQILDAAAIRALEPALSPDYRRGFLLPEGGFVRDPLRVTQALARYLASIGGRFVTAAVRDLSVGAEGVRALVTDRGDMPVDRLVIAAGVWSRPLAARLGVRAPMTSERGYHIQIAEPGVPLQHQITDAEGRFTATPMEGGLRVTGTSEFSGLGAPPRWARAEALARLIPTMLPGVRTEPCSRWTGHRPSTPDGRPIIGASPRCARAFLAYGHGHWGLMAAPVTGQLIADLVAGRPPRIDTAPFSPTRFRHP